MPVRDRHPRPAVRARTVAECLDRPAHAASLAGAHGRGEAAADGRVVQIGLWREGGGLRARFRASTCAPLIAYAEVACAALEAGGRPDAAALAPLLRGVHPGHRDRAALVARAVTLALAALDARAPLPAASPVPPEVP